MLTIEDKIAVRQIANEEVQYSLGETNQRLTAVEDRLTGLKTEVTGLKGEVTGLGERIGAVETLLVRIAAKLEVGTD